MSLDDTNQRSEAIAMLQTMLLFFAPPAVIDRDLVSVREVREPQAHPVLRSRRTATWGAAVTGSLRIVGDALGLVVLIAACWLTLPLMALLFP